MNIIQRSDLKSFNLFTGLNGCGKTITIQNLNDKHEFVIDGKGGQMNDIFKLSQIPHKFELYFKYIKKLMPSLSDIDVFHKEKPNQNQQFPTAVNLLFIENDTNSVYRLDLLRLSKGIKNIIFPITKILLLSHRTRNTFVRIDEIETSIHYSLYNTYINILVDLMNEFSGNITYVITTQSLEFITQFSQIANQQENADKMQLIEIKAPHPEYGFERAEQHNKISFSILTPAQVKNRLENNQTLRGENDNY